MKLTYRISEQTGVLGGRSFVVQAHVQLSQNEASIRSGYSVYETIDVGEKFKDIKGIDILGQLQLADLLARPKDFKFSTIQMAGGFADALVEGIQSVKGQIEATRARIDSLNKEQVMEI